MHLCVAVSSGFPCKLYSLASSCSGRLLHLHEPLAFTFGAAGVGHVARQLFSCTTKACAFSQSCSPSSSQRCADCACCPTQQLLAAGITTSGCQRVPRRASLGLVHCLAADWHMPDCLAIQALPGVSGYHVQAACGPCLGKRCCTRPPAIHVLSCTQEAAAVGCMLPSHEQASVATPQHLGGATQQERVVLLLDAHTAHQCVNVLMLATWRETEMPASLAQSLLAERQRRGCRRV